MSAAPLAATEKSRSAWRNAKARLGRLSPELQGWVESLTAAGERDGVLLLVDPGALRPCRRCEALVSQALMPLGYAGARILAEPELPAGRPR